MTIFPIAWSNHLTYFKSRISRISVIFIEIKKFEGQSICYFENYFKEEHSFICIMKFEKSVFSQNIFQLLKTDHC